VHINIFFVTFFIPFFVYLRIYLCVMFYFTLFFISRARRLFACLVMASKVWDDLSMWNVVSTLFYCFLFRTCNFFRTIHLVKCWIVIRRSHNTPPHATQSHCPFSNPTPSPSPVPSHSHSLPPSLTLFLSILPPLSLSLSLTGLLACVPYFQSPTCERLGADHARGPEVPHQSVSRYAIPYLIYPLPCPILSIASPHTRSSPAP
jgi:hypothetical protein